jgi:hypothetical protein
MIETNLEINITDDNNFFASNSAVERIKYNMNISPSRVTNDEIQLLKKVNQRKNMCIDQDMHYFVLPDSSSSLGAYCYWCNLTASDYAQISRNLKNE